MKKTKTKIAVAAASGAIVGGVLGILFAPRKGSETRSLIKNSVIDMKDKLSGIDKESIKNYIEKALDDIEKEVAKLEVTTEYKKAKRQAKRTIKKIDKLAGYAKRKGIEGFEEMISNLKDMASDISEEILTNAKN